MSNKLSELRELKEMYEIRLKSDNVDKSLKDHYQTMLDTINEKIEKNQIFRRYFNRRLGESEICPSCDKVMSSHGNDQALQCMRNFVEKQAFLNIFNQKQSLVFMGLFGNKSKKIVITGTVCQICGMNFTAADRLLRHMIKAHGKVKRDSGTSCPNC